MIRITQIKIPVDDNDIKKAIAKKLKISLKEIISFKIVKQSIDARDKENVYFVYSCDVKVKNEESILKRQILNVSKNKEENYQIPVMGKVKLKEPIVIVGMGPAGLFAGYLLTSCGYKTIIIERGKKVEKRMNDVLNFWNENC